MRGRREEPDPVREYVRENADLLADVIVGGTPEAKAYALTLLAEARDPRAVEQAQRALDKVKREMGL